MSELKRQIEQDKQSAMRAKDAPRLSAIRLIIAAVQQREIDERIELNDEQVIVILDKLAKQRRESITQFQQANRQDLVDKETLELGIIQGYLPAALDDAEVDSLIQEAITDTAAQSMKDMGKVMKILKPKMQGRTDLTAVSAKIKTLLGNPPTA